jgi:hypothetical protein
VLSEAHPKVHLCAPSRTRPDWLKRKLVVTKKGSHFDFSAPAALLNPNVPFEAELGADFLEVSC